MKRRSCGDYVAMKAGTKAGKKCGYKLKFWNKNKRGKEAFMALGKLWKFEEGVRGGG